MPLCSHANPATDSVEVNFSELRAPNVDELELGLVEQKEREHAEEQYQRQMEAEHQQALLEQQRQLEEKRLEEERLQEMALQRQREQARREERNARLRHEQEQRRLAQERDLEERRKSLERFFTRYGFTGINNPRKSGCVFWGATTTYPLHCAAELADVHTVEALLKEGANRSQKDSSGKTPVQAARKKNKVGSHDGVLRLLAGEPSQARSGGA